MLWFTVRAQATDCGQHLGLTALLRGLRIPAFLRFPPSKDFIHSLLIPKGCTTATKRQNHYRRRRTG